MPQLILTICAAVCTLAYGLVLLLQRRRNIAVFAQSAGLVGCMGLELADLGALFHPEQLVQWKFYALVAEAFLPACWLLFALTFARKGGWRGIALPSRLVLLASCAFPLVLLVPLSSIYYSPDFVAERILFLGRDGYIFYVALMIALVVALFYLEQTIRSLPRAERWRVKFEIIGVGVILTMLVIYYSQALLYRSLDMNLMPVRSLSLIAGITLMIFSRLRRGVVVERIRVSREVVYRSVVILAVSFYLIVLGLFGTGMRYLDVVGNRVVFVALALFIGLGLVIVLLSEQIQRRMRVVLHKNFYQNKYDYRKKWLQFTAKLGGAKSRADLEKGVLDFFAETFSVQGAALFLLDHDADEYRCSTCLESDALGLSMPGYDPLIETMRDSDWVVELDKADVDLSDGDWSRLLSRKDVFLVPLRFDHSLEGFIALGQRVYEKEPLTYEDFDLMKILANQTIGVLLSHKLYADLAVANEMAAIGRVSTFVIHDLKNLVSGLAMVVENSREYIDDPEFRTDMFETLENTVANMKGLISRLQNVRQAPALDMSCNDLLTVAQTAIALCGNGAVTMEGQTVPVVCDSAELQKVLLNLLHNAREASAEGMSIEVSVGCTDMAFVQISDHGRGMSADFVRHRLFKPFETTKKQGVGIGLYQCHQVIKAHGGRIDVRSYIGNGSIFTVWLPLAKEGNSGGNTTDCR